MKAKQFATALYRLTDKKSKDDSEKIVDVFVKVLKRKGALTLLPAIKEELSLLKVKKEDEESATVISSKEISESHAEKLVERITDKKVRIKTKVDDTIIGGEIVLYKFKQIDRSFKKSLEKIYNNIIQSA